MKLDKKIQRDLVENLRKWQRQKNDRINYYIQEIEKVPSNSTNGVEQIMVYKNEMLYYILGNLCLGSDHCYFCLKYWNGDQSGCSKCEYGKFHGICFRSSSFYKKISQRLLKLKRSIYDSYYKF